jgi:hypothetical protein
MKRVGEVFMPGKIETQRPDELPFRMSACRSLLIVLAVSAGGCRAIPATQPAQPSIGFIAAPFDIADRDDVRRVDATGVGLIVLDSASLRPYIANDVASGSSSPRVTPGSSRPPRFAIATTHQGGRYRPETIRAIATDTTALALAAGAIARTAAQLGTGLILDFQGSTSEDIHGLVDLLRAIGDFGRPLGTHPLGMVLPPGDTVSYPTEILSRVADVLVLRLHGEHRPGTAAGPPTSEDFIAREIGIRSRASGTSRLAAELPLFGYRWSRDGTAAPVTYQEAQRVVLGEAGTFRRDPATQFLTSTGREGWTIWVPDAVTVAALVTSVTKRGVNRIFLAGPSGADPAVASWWNEQVRRRSGPSGTPRE